MSYRDKVKEKDSDPDEASMIPGIDETENPRTSIHCSHTERELLKIIEDETNYNGFAQRHIIRDALYALADEQGIELPFGDRLTFMYDPDRDSEDSSN